MKGSSRVRGCTLFNSFPTMILILSLSLLVVVSIWSQTCSASGCPRMHCAPIISKCQLIDACRCEAKLNYTCMKACSHCLGDLFSDCCSCVGICPDEVDDPTLEAHVKVFSSTNDDLFELFANDEDLSDRWHIHRMSLEANSSAQMHCTMAFLSPCIDMYKCESSCLALGASGYRWFHIGCCECVGERCKDFGINEIRCRSCPNENDQVIDSLNDPL